MEELTIQYEQSLMRAYKPGEMACIYADKCIGNTFVDIHDRCAGIILPRLVTPQGASFGDRCVLCLRRDITRQFYRILYEPETPQSTIIHPYTVKIDEQDEYDGDCCLFPPTCDPDSKTRFVGLVGPYPRFDAITLEVKEDRIEQVGVKYNIIPSILKPFIRQGARKVSFFYNTTAALILAGYICDVKPSSHIDVVDIYKKCITKRNNQRIDIDDTYNKATKKWLNDLNVFMYNDMYNTKQPCEFAYGVNELTTAVQEHIVFLISKDPLLYEAVVRNFPDWDSFVEYTKTSADHLRRGESLSKIQKVYLQSNNPEFLNKIIRCREWPLRSYPTYVPEVFDRLKKLPNIEKEIDNLLAYDYDEFSNYVGGLINQHMYQTILLPTNKQQPEMIVYVCTVCQSFKSQSDTPKSFYGHSMLSMDWCNRELYCELKDLTGRRNTQENINKRRKRGEEVTTVTSKKNGCRPPLLKIPMGTHLAHINSFCKVICEKCNKVCDYSLNRMFYRPLCSVCIEKKEDIKCIQCGSKRSDNCNVKWMSIKAFKDGGLSGCNTYWFCKRHTFQCTKLLEYWALPVLLEKVNSIFVKKSAKKSST